MASLRSCAAPLRRVAAAKGLPATSSLGALRYNSSGSSSTSAIAYKALRNRSAPLPVTNSPPSWSAQAAVSNILYETPTPSMVPPKRHILNCLVQNEPGVLSRLSGILAARGFNIDSLVVCNTEVEDLSRMTIVLTGQDGVVEQARRQLEDLVPVWAVLDYSNAALVQRELLLAKINILGPEYFEELLVHHREMTAGEHAPEGVERQTQSLEELAQDFHPSKLAASEALRHKHEHLKTITYFTHQFGGKVLDISTISCIVELYVMGTIQIATAQANTVTALPSRRGSTLSSSWSRLLASSSRPVPASWPCPDPLCTAPTRSPSSRKPTRLSMPASFPLVKCVGPSAPEAASAAGVWREAEFGCPNICNFEFKWLNMLLILHSIIPWYK